MSILLEQRMMKKFLLKRVSTNPSLLELSLENVSKAEAMISHNSRYNLNDVETNIKDLNLFIKNKKFIKLPNLEDQFKKVVSTINTSNNTRMSNSEVDSIVSYLLTIHSELLERLYRRDFCLVCELVTCSARKNYSFATKFCHYMSYYLFSGRKQQDNYSIYDSVVANILGTYAAYYGIYKIKKVPYVKKDFDCYKKYSIYSDVIDKIRASLPVNISRNGLDHLLWYANK